MALCAALATFALPAHAAQKKQLKTRNVLAQIGASGAAYALAFSPDSAQVAGALKGRVGVWNTADGGLVQNFDVSGWAISLAFSPDGTQLAAGTEKGVVQVWSVKDGAKVASFEGHEGKVTGVAFSSDGKQVFSGGADKTARMWDLAGAKPVRAPITTPCSVYALILSRDGKTLRIGGGDSGERADGRREGNGQAIIADYDIATGNTGGIESADRLAPPYQFDLRRKLILGRIKEGADYTITVWQANGGFSNAKIHNGIEQLATAMVFERDVLLVDHLLTRIKTETDILDTAYLQALGSAVLTTAAFAPDGDLFAVADESGRISLWRLSKL